MPTVDTLTTYLEMWAPPPQVLPTPRSDVSITQLHQPTTETYRVLYRGVGGNYHWVDRLIMPEDKLRAILDNPSISLFVLRVDGQVGGYCELDRSVPGEIELVYFGLFPSMIGQGLGRYFLNWTLHQAWSYQPKRVWVHTCDLDHPAALPNYVRAGMTIYDSHTISQTIPDNWQEIVASGLERLQP